MAAHSSQLETAVSKTNATDFEVAELRADLVDLSQQLRMDAMRVDELEGVVNPMMTDEYQAVASCFETCLVVISMMSRVQVAVHPA